MKLRLYPITLGLLLTLTVQATELENITLPDMGDSAGTLISPQQEQEFGAAFFRSLHNRVTINQDPEIQHYIDSLGSRLASHSDTPGYPFHFFVVLDKTINAFAGPGGYIGVNSGLILLTESESELASVIGHEIAHVTQRHLYRAFEAAKRMTLPMAAATLAALLIGSQSPAAGQAAIMAVQAGSVQFQINFTRDNEKEADRIGMQILSKSDYDPRSMPVFFERLQQSSRFYGQNIPEFLRTHPVSASRIADTRGRAESYPYRQYPDSRGYTLARAKLRVITMRPEQSLKYFAIRQHQGTDWQKAVAAYGSALVHLKQRHFKQAAALADTLLHHYPQQPQFALLQAQTATQNQHYQKALNYFRQSLTRFPHYQPLKLAYIQTLLYANQPEQAKALLENMQSVLQNQPVYYQLLAKSHAALGHEAESHRYLAEYEYATGQTQAAIMQLQLAKKAKDLNFYLKAIIEERLHQFISEEQLRKTRH
jgi:predicted Zn-dependent protease